MRRLFYIVWLFLALPFVAQEELCMDGTLLFREDFGGNDPDDPAVSSQNVPGMSSQYYNSGNSLGSGHYTVRKEGWSNGIQWHRQDDHTYPDDKTRGYLLEVDGIGGAEPFYSTTIDGLCAGSKLTFSAYVVNVHYAGQLDYFGGSYVYPRMKFVLKDPTTGEVLAEKSTGDIQPDWRYGTPETWKYARDNVLSAEWQLMGINFVVPEGVESIQMFIYNDVERNGSGNDFALDDIEIHLCLPQPEIIGEPEVCENYASNLSAAITNDGTMAEPLEYKWWHSTDSITWTEIAGTTNTLAFTTTQKADSGWYQVSVSGAGNIESVNCRAVSDPFRLKVNECEPPKPALCLDGILLFREDFGGNDPNDPRVGTTPVSGMSYTQLTSDRFGVMGAGKYLVTKSGYCNGDTSVNNLPQNRRSQWHLQDDHTYPNDRTRGYLLEIDARADNAAFYQTTIEHLCEGIELTFSAYVANVMTWGQYMGRPGMYAYPRLKFVLTNPTDNTELATYDTGDIPFDSTFINDYTCWQQSAQWQLVGMNFTVPVGVDAIQLNIYNNVDNAIGNDFALDDIEIHLCMTPDTIRTDTTVCDTLSRITWRGKEFAITDTLRDTLLSSCGFDSIYYELHVTTAPCEEELCIDGILLFREDFGGNDPNDPIVGTQQVPGMDYSRYTQRLNADHVTGQPGLFWLIKSGYYHADTTGGRDPMHNHSNWYLQDDHTYPNDKTRGYLLEIDGMGGTAPFYSTVVQGVCPGMRLTFSAYVANVNKASNYIDGIHARVYPKLKFEIEDAKTHTVLGSHSTGDIPYDPDLTVNTDFWYSSKWYLHGMTFTMPEAVDSIRLTIYNDVMNNGAGNDFALDDIEIRLCMTPDTIRTDTTVCDTLSRITWHGKEFALTDTLRDTLLSSCGFDSIYYELHVTTAPCEEELCMDGILLFREDFGGNDPSDPRVGTNLVPGMSYTQVTNDVFRSMGSGKYIVTKSGYCNGDTTGWSLPGADQSTYRSQWYIQDDHTYPNDYSRGYFMEIDGSGGNQQFYQTEISGLCEGIKLTFSAYVANVFTWFQYDWYTRNRGPVIAPCLKFVLTNPQTGETLVEKNTQQIPFAEDLAVKTDWQYSSPWYLVGMNFIVPTGIPAIRLTIYNNVTNGNGNDFALDDIEIHLCMTPDTIRTDTTVCDTISRITWRGKEFALADTLRDTVFSSCGFDSIYYELHVERVLCEKPDTKADCYDPAQELHGFSVSADMKVVFAPGNMQYNAAMGQHLCADGTMQPGTWRFAEHQWDYIGSHASASSTYNGWIDLYAWGTSGWSNGVEEYQPWSWTIGASNCYYINGDASLSMTGDYENADWAVYNSIGEYSPNSWRTLSAEEWEFILNGRTNASILCGKATINNVCGLIFLPDDYPFADLSLPQFIPGNDRFCSTNKYTESQWEQLENKGAVFLPAAGVIYGGNNNYPNIHGYYWSVSACNENKQSRAYNLEFYSDVNYPSTQITPGDRRGGKSVRPVMDIPKDYVPTVKMDTTVCDTLLPITWRGHKWEASGVIIDTLQSVCGADSICLRLSLQTEKCCRDLITIVSDTTVCDTLLPFTWRGMEFAETGEKRIIEKNSRECDSIEYIYALSTYTCEKLWPIIVNKYNWQLLCDNVALRNFFPERTATAFQWYKNEQPISGATEDDYAEQNELCGVFQLNVKLDDGRSIWSNIIEIKAKDEIPIRVQIYNSQGMPVSEEQLSQGVYLYRYERGEEVWIEKKWIP